MSATRPLPVPSGKNDAGNVDEFTSFMRRLVSVPHSEIKAQLDAEKAAKQKIKASVSRVSGAPSKKR
jgi:hypothetical protein